MYRLRHLWAELNLHAWHLDKIIIEVIGANGSIVENNYLFTVVHLTFSNAKMFSVQTAVYNNMVAILILFLHIIFYNQE